MQPINIFSIRAKKARIAQKYSKPLVLALKSIFILSLLGGLAATVRGIEAGYLILTLSSLSLMLLLWNKGELSKLKYNLGRDSVDGLLDPEILARIKSSTPSAMDIWVAAQKTEARYFFQNRFMLPPSILEQFLSQDPNSANAVWEHAERLRQSHGLASYTPAVIIVALLRSIPNIEQLLNQARLEISDLETGVSWLTSIERKRELAKKSERYGGWGRDLAYGYTPLLSRLGHNVSREVELYGFFEDTSVHDQVVDQIVNSMGSGNSDLLLIGETGSGRTTSVYAFAKRLLKPGDVPANIWHHQVVGLDATSLIAQAQSPGQLEALMIQLLNEAIKAKNIILFFDDAYAFFSQGTGSIDLSNVLQPALESGSVRAIFAMTPKQQQEVASGGIVARLQKIQVKPTGEEETMHVLRDRVLAIEAQQKTFFTNQALREAIRLGDRYVDDQVMPGAAINILRAAAPMSKDGYITAEIIQRSIEASQGVKLATAEVDESSKLLNLEDELHQYVINQVQAVSAIADALRRSRSGVGNLERPVGTFLFLGPTGVGKTELSKALARVYYGSENALIRVDMNQYVQPEDVDRLITPMQGEQLGFLGQVRRSPFSVILLDEVEKAHPNVVNLLLQMLDEGVMKDIDNKPVSFKDAIVIATSNAGADKIREMISAGQDIVKAQEELVDYIIDQKIFAPEFVNRFDEAVMFRPLTPNELVKVIDLILAGINKTLDKQKVQVELTVEARRWLVDKGYDQRLGARPMRRVAQKYVENIMAKKLLQKDAASGSVVRLDVADFEALDHNDS